MRKSLALCLSHARGSADGTEVYSCVWEQLTNHRLCWRDSLIVKGTQCSCGRSGFGFQPTGGWDTRIWNSRKASATQWISASLGCRRPCLQQPTSQTTTTHTIYSVSSYSIILRALLIWGLACLAFLQYLWSTHSPFHSFIRSPFMSLNHSYSLH